jgi:hypothetical protein
MLSFFFLMNAESHVASFYPSGVSFWYLFFESLNETWCLFFHLFYFSLVLAILS